ncbi:hypothetical protein K7432_004515 [Basidiobolus ranarum]|uniref:Uncharacterized protein n=1 Tax=Basidiobolus ranarum TaxID=34480 RepID=A0ABR2W4J2_9FUNG
MDFRKVRRWVSNPFGNKTDKRRFQKNKRSNTDLRRRNTIAGDSVPTVNDISVDFTRPVSLTIPRSSPSNAITMDRHYASPTNSGLCLEPLEIHTPAAPPNSPISNSEIANFQLLLESQEQNNIQQPSRSHGYKTKFSGKLKRMKGMFTGDWEMQVRGEMELLNGEAEITAYRLLKHGYQPNEIVCG